MNLSWLKIASWSLALLAVFVPVIAYADIELLQPLGSQTSIPISPGLGTLLAYVNDALDWVFDIALGVSVFWIVVAGFMIMISGGSGRFSGYKEEGVKHMTWAITGLIILLFSGLIMRLLNSVFYV